MYKNQKISAVLLMGGLGFRFQSTLPKQFHYLSGKRVYLYALDALARSGLFDEILLVCHKDWKETVAKETKKIPTVSIIEGGSSRQESSYLGLLHCSNPHLVLIHDAVRPFVSQRILLENIEHAFNFGAVDTCVASSDTIIYSEDQKILTSIPDRKRLLRGQTPQTFSYPLILEAHEHALKKKMNSVSDDCRLVVELGKNVSIVAGEESNIKITSKLDLFLAEQILRLQPKILPPSSASLKNKHFLLIGGNGGMGRAISSLLQKEGACVTSVSKLSSPWQMDLTQPKSIESFFSSFHRQHGPIDGLIQSAGVLTAKSLEELSLSEIEEMIQVNLFGLIYSCKLARIKEKGHIVNIASSSFFRGRKDQSIYSATKAAVVNFTQALSEEKPHLCINALIPQRTNTSMRRSNFPEEDVEELLSPECVAETVVELLKDSSTTGSLIEVKKA